MVEAVDKEVMAKQERRVRARRTEGCRVEIKARKHAFIADEPAQGGGTDTGPTPRTAFSTASPMRGPRQRPRDHGFRLSPE